MSESQESRVEKTSTEMKAEYLNKTLQIYKNKSKQLYEKNQELIKQNERLNDELQKSKQQISGLMAEVGSLKNLCFSSSEQKQRIASTMNEKMKGVLKQELQAKKYREAFEETQKLNNILTKEVQVLKNDKIQINLELQEKGLRMLQFCDIAQSKQKQIQLLQDLNRNLKFQVEELLMELKIIERRKVTKKLLDYEEKMQTRVSQEDDPEIVSLLQERIVMLQKQVQQANRKYKNLQNVVYNN